MSGSIVTPSEFFNALYQGVDKRYIVAYGPVNGPYEFAHTDVPWFLNTIGEKDIYFRVCPLAKQPPTNLTRGVQRSPGALVGVWVDIDCGDKGKGKRYFKSRDEAIKFCDDWVLYSALVSSGTGLHGYLRFHQPIYYNTKAETDYAYALVQRFQAWFRERSGYDIDPTHDLARVLRVPGTLHGSSTVEVISYHDRVVTPEWIEDLPVSERLAPMSDANAEALGFSLSPSPDIDHKILVNMFAANPKFYETWIGHRTPRDESPSGWRFSMLSFLLQMGMNKQDAVNYTIHFLTHIRGYRPDQIKLDRPDVWAAEIAKINVSTFTQEDIERVITGDDRGEKIRAIAGLMELPEPHRLADISRFEIRAGDDVVSKGVLRLHLVMPDGEVRKIELSDPLSRSVSRKQLFDCSGIILPNYTTKAAQEANRKWEQAITAAFHVAEVCTPVERSATETLIHAIRSFIESGEIVDSPERAKETGRPCRRGDAYVIPTVQFYLEAQATYPALRDTREVHSAIRELEKILKTKVKCLMFEGVRMSCLVVPAQLGI